MKSAPVRSLLGLILIGLAIAIWVRMAPRVIEAADYGAIPDDGKDDTKALSQLLADATRQGRTTVKLAPGRYEVAAEPKTKAPIFDVRGAHDLLIDGRGAKIVVSGIAPLFSFTDSTNVQVKRLMVDWAVRPAVGMRVVGVESDRIVMKRETPGRFTSPLPLEALYLFDLAERRPAAGRGEWYWIDGVRGPSLHPVADDLFSLPLQGYDAPLPGSALRIGDRVLLRFVVYGSNAFTFTSCADVTVADVVIESAPGMGFMVRGTENFELTRTAVRPAPGQWISTCADAAHFADCRGTVAVRDCEFEAMGDDGLNVHANLLRVRSTESAKTIIMERGRSPQSIAALLPRVGDELTLAPKSAPLEFGPVVKVVQSAYVSSQPFMRLECDQLLPDGFGEGSTAVNQSGNAALIAERVTVRRNRARGFLIQTPKSVRIADCTFEGMSGSAIQLTSDVGHWWEGPPVQDVQITGCRFVGGNDGPGRHKGLLSIFVDEEVAGPAKPVHSGIGILRNVFLHYGEVAISVSAAREVTIEGNRFVGEGQPVLTDPLSSSRLIHNQTAKGPE